MNARTPHRLFAWHVLAVGTLLISALGCPPSKSVSEGGTGRSTADTTGSSTGGESGSTTGGGTGGTLPEPPSPSGAPEISDFGVLKVKNGLTLDILNGSTDDAAPAMQWYTNGAPSQVWQFVRQNAAVQVKNRKSSQCLQPAFGSSDLHVVQQPCAADPNQFWRFEAVSPYTFRITHVNSGLALDAGTAAPSPAHLVQVASLADALQQLWVLAPVNAEGILDHRAPLNAGDANLVWPNAESSKNSDAWLRTHHQAITQMRPRLLVLNFENGRTQEEVERFARNQAVALAEGSRYRGYRDPHTPIFLNYQIAQVLNLVDDAVPAGCPNSYGGSHECSSTLTPRRVQNPQDPNAGLTWDYARMFSRDFAPLLQNADPNAPGQYLTLCQLFERGIIHEVWINGGGSGGPAEFLQRAPRFDASLRPTGEWEPCAGNGCFDTPADSGTCSVTVRIGNLAMNRGIGCGLHAYGHGIEGMNRANLYFARVNKRFFNSDLQSREGAPIANPYGLVYESKPSCTTHPYPPSLDFHSPTQATGYANLGGDPCGQPFELHDMWRGCGSVHYAPNSTYNYDYERDDAGDANGRRLAVPNTCEDYGLGNAADGNDLRTAYTYAKVALWDQIGFDDCGGGWQIYWRQSMPGLRNAAKDDLGQPMLNWWPFLFY